MKKIICIIVVIVSVCLLSSALADDTDKFLGKWICYNVTVDGKTYTMSSIDAELELAVRTDGTAKVYMLFDGTMDLFEGAWLAEGNDMAVTDGQYYMLFSMNASGKLEVKAEGAEFILDHIHAIEINEQNFPDENFRSYLSSNVDSSYGGDSLLTDSEISRHNELTIYSSWQITDLTGIAFFSGLKKLECQGNLLTSLDLSGNKELRELNCYSNQLTSLDVSKCTKLTRLECGENQLAELDVSKNKALKELYCGHNSLTQLNISKNTKLQWLGCSNNLLTKLDVSRNKKLKQLYCYNNQLTSLDLKNSTALYDLECGNNRLTELDLSHNAAMSHLVCSGNPLMSLDISSNPDLWSLFCNDCQLSRLDLSGHANLRNLRCSGNRIAKLDLSGNPNLQQLYCSGNLLTELDLSNNSALTELDCSDNCLAALDLSKNKQLKMLDCSNNRLAALDVSKNKQLGDLGFICDGNRFEIGTKDGTIPFTDLPGFNIKKAASIKFTADDGSKATVKKGKTQFTVKKSGVITYTYKADSKRGFSCTFSIRVDFLKPDITTVTLKKKSYPYTGRPIEPTMVVKAKADGKAVKLSASDYTVTYENNVDAGTATVIVEGQGSYGGRIEKTFTITPVKILKVELSKYELPYNGKGRKPVPTVTAKAGGQTVTLEKDKDYTVKYENNKQPGTATVTITGKGNYTGTIVKTFMIVEK